MYWKVMFKLTLPEGDIRSLKTMTPLSSALEGELKRVSEYRAKLYRTIWMNWTKWNEWMKEWMNAWNECWVTDERTSDVFFLLYIIYEQTSQGLKSKIVWWSGLGWTHDLLLGGLGPISRKPRLFTVIYFSVRSSRSSALRYGLPSCTSVKTT